jgi:hypothetical protein
MRTLSSACAVAATAMASLLFAPAAHATTPGDNGTIKIHDAGTGEELKKNEPHVCTFYLDAFGFDGQQQADWKIVEMPPTGDKGKVADSGAITLDGNGHGRTEDQTLPDGHYKLIWNFDGEHGQAKHKVFWTDCANDSGTGGTKPTGSPSPSASASESGAATGGTEPTGSASPSASASESGAAAGGTEPTGSASASTASSNGTGSGNLAETGAAVGGLTLTAVLLLGAGTVLVMHRRKTRQH